jgi:uncharacterized membrane protein YbhN (UPF0104 family)
MLMLAEISDKMPTVLSTVLVSTVVTAIALGLAGLRWWLALLALPVFSFWNWALYVELREPSIGPQIWKEMGAGYVVGQFISINTPVAIGALIVTRLRRTQVRKQHQSKGLCARCAYPSTTGQCPECGESSPAGVEFNTERVS